ncbi:MAG: uracil-DNA glycosylase [Sphingomonadales bacterium]|jgi:DNA polymerase|nr:uracil-DNA glycosylase [Sphingomonadales bacterium]
MKGDGDFSAGEAVASVLRWWSDAGVDVLLDERPRDWLKPRVAPPPADEAPVEVKGDAPPEQLGLFRAWLAESPALPYAAPAAPRVCPSGDPESDLMILTDMPSSEDCSAGTLISGEAGRLFDRMLAAIGRNRDTIYLAALSCLRSPDGRFNTEGAKSCAALARHHAGLVKPKALLIFGDAASKALLGLPLAQARGKWHDLPTHAGPVRALVTLPPSYLLNQPAAKAHAWADLQRLAEEVKR